MTAGCPGASGAGSALTTDPGLSRDFHAPFPVDVPLTLSAHRHGGGDPAHATEQQALTARAGHGRRGHHTEHQVARALDERLRRADVEPVGGPGVAHHDRPGGDQAGERLPLHRHNLAGRDLVDDRPAKDVTAGVDQFAHRVRRLLEERGDPPGGVGGHAAVPAGVVHLDQVQRHRRLALAVQVHLGRHVVGGQDVAVQHDDGVVGTAAQQGRRVADPATRPERGRLVDVVNGQSEVRAVAERVGEHLGTVGGREDHVRDTALRRPRELMREERDACGR